ncbi:MAG: glycosyltransferase [Candidatus Bathyarchaeia archaeon]
MDKKIIMQIRGPTLFADSLRYKLPNSFRKAYASFVKNGEYIIYRYSLGTFGMMSLKSIFLWEFVYSPWIIHRLARRGFHMVSCGLMGWWAFLAFIFAKALGRPVVVGDNHWYWPSTFFAKLHFPLSRLVAQHSTLLYLTRGASIFWREVGIPVEKMRIGFPPDYVPKLDIGRKDILRTEEIRRCLGLESKAIVLFFGRLIKKKGVEFLIRAFKRIHNEHKDVFLLICGDGPERANLEKLCRDLGISNVLFYGFVEPEDKNALFLICDIFVYPSITLEIPEEWPLAVCEAMSVGKPVIVTNAVGSVKDGLVRHGFNGLVVSEKNVESLYKAMDILLRDDRLRSIMGENARKTIQEDFAYSKGFKRLHEVWEEALSLCYV